MGWKGLPTEARGPKIKEKGIQNVQKGVLPKSQKFQNGFVDGPVPFLEAANPFVQYLAPLGAKYMGKRLKKNKKCRIYTLWGWLT